MSAVVQSARLRRGDVSASRQLAQSAHRLQSIKYRGQPSRLQDCHRSLRDPHTKCQAGLE